MHTHRHDEDLNVLKETREKIANSKKGQKMSEEQKRKIQKETAKGHD